MTTHVTDAVLVPTDAWTRTNTAELARVAFLARFRVAGTRATYEIALRQWFAWCDEHHLDPLEVKRPHIELFARELEITGRKVSTVAGKLGVLAGYYQCAFRDGLIPVDPMTHVVRPTVERRSTTNGLSRTEFADILRVAEEGPVKEHALICLLGYNGLRISEVTGIDIEHLGRFKGQVTADVTRKGGKTQTIPMAPRTAWAVEQLVDGRTTGALFLTREGHRMDRRTAGRIINRIAKKAGVTKRISPHSFRHTFVTLSLDAGVPERDIAISTGHADTRMVSYYDRNRENIMRNSTHAVAAWVEGAA